MSSKLPSKSVATAAVTQSIRSASKSVKTSTELVWTYIRGSNIEIREVHDNNYPVWFWWLIVAGCMICCISCMAWVVCALFFFKREKPCTHTVHVVVDHEAGSPRKQTRSPKKEEEAVPDGPSPNENPPTDGNGSFTNPLTPDYARSSKRSSRKEGGAPKKPEPLPDAAGGSKKSAKSGKSGKSSGSRKSSKNGSKKSSKNSSKKSGKSSKSAEPIDRQDGGKDKEYCIEMDSNDIEMASEPIKYGFFQKVLLW
ncbi:hypothetical protein CRE_28303 [Caenorhabditis remanei]|uniref:Uncharacterized protein n=1 Tax=Caenorhabditis remanei TaxID=31234 RepID=E3LN86_CAERE|nr:hypothetical protein CRE_28303 [Caenorhabditis remanei]